MTKRLVAFCVAMMTVLLLTAGGSRPIPRDSRLYIEPMPNDLHVYIKAEIVKKGVAIRVVSSAEDADLIMSGSASGKEEKAWHEGWLTAQTDKVKGAVVITDLNGELVWAAEAGDRSLWWASLKRGGERKVAGRLVSQMKKAIGNRARGGTTRIGTGPGDWWIPANPETTEGSAAPDPENRTVRLLEEQSAPVHLAPGQSRETVTLTEGMPPNRVIELLGEPDRSQESGDVLVYSYSQMDITFVKGALDSVKHREAQTATAEIKEGMSPEEVERIFGAPERKATIAGKTIYFYPRMKLTFVDGALVGIE